MAATDASNPMRRLLTPSALAERWSISSKTLANNRTRGTGPAFVRINGGTVRYPLDAVEAYERANTVQAVA